MMDRGAELSKVNTAYSVLYHSLMMFSPLIVSFPLRTTHLARLQRYATAARSSNTSHGRPFELMLPAGSASRTAAIFWRYVSCVCSRFDGADTLQDANQIQQVFSSSKHATIYRVLPQIEIFLSRWEKKHTMPKYALFWPALDAGLNKMRKYYYKFDEKPVYVLGMCTFSHCPIDLSFLPSITRCSHPPILQAHLDQTALGWGEGAAKGNQGRQQKSEELDCRGGADR